VLNVRKGFGCSFVPVYIHRVYCYPRDCRHAPGDCSVSRGAGEEIPGSPEVQEPVAQVATKLLPLVNQIFRSGPSP